MRLNMRQCITNALEYCECGLVISTMQFSSKVECNLIRDAQVSDGSQVYRVGVGVAMDYDQFETARTSLKATSWFRRQFARSWKY